MVDRFLYAFAESVNIFRVECSWVSCRNRRPSRCLSGDGWSDRRRRILHCRQTCCVSLAEVAMIIFPDQIIILKIIDKSYIKCFSEPAFRLVCFIVKQQSGSFRKLQQDHGAGEWQPSLRASSRVRHASDPQRRYA